MKRTQKKDFYQSHSEQIKKKLDEKYTDKNIYQLIIDKEKSTIDNNLSNWVDKDTLPQKKNVFETLLEYVDYKDNIAFAWKALKKEIASNQQHGRTESRELKNLLTDGFSLENFETQYNGMESFAFTALLEEIKKNNLSKKYNINIYLPEQDENE